MTDILSHRGPDDEGIFCDDRVSLGHRRLSIIDTSNRGHQPMQFEHLQIVFNGEIYNYQELRAELKTAGYQFQSDSDTEVLLKAYHHWGINCVNRLNGMWAICIYDSQHKTLFLSRDRFGIKPFYYYHKGQTFVFASELKAIRPLVKDLKVNTTALNYFFYQKYIGADLTIYENCYKLKPSENIIYNLDTHHIHKSSYYSLSDSLQQQSQRSLKERLEEVAGLLTDAVIKRLVADVPVGSFLSGGLDSSLISAIIARDRQNFQTFSIGFQDKSYDEIPFSKTVAEYIRTRHHIEYLEIDEPLIERVVGHMDEPFGDASILPTTLLSEMTRRHVTVCLSGDAGDEVFAGYDSYKAYQYARVISAGLIKACSPFVNMLPPSDKKLTLAFKIQKFTEDYHPNPWRRHLDWMGTFTDRDRQTLLQELYICTDYFIGPAEANTLTGMQMNDFQRYLPEDILKKVDAASMMHSLEVRVPFLDHRLVPIVMSLPSCYKIRFLKTKWLLKRLASDLLPTEIIHRKKRGFTVPVSAWLRKSELIRQVIIDSEFYGHGFINSSYASQLLDDHLQKRADNARQLWLVFVFNFWWHKIHRQSI